MLSKIGVHSMEIREKVLSHTIDYPGEKDLIKV